MPVVVGGQSLTISSHNNPILGLRGEGLGVIFGVFSPSSATLQGFYPK
jgi:hypothetical protein